MQLIKKILIVRPTPWHRCRDNIVYGILILLFSKHSINVGLATFNKLNSCYGYQILYYRVWSYKRTSVILFPVGPHNRLNIPVL